MPSIDFSQVAQFCRPTKRNIQCKFALICCLLAVLVFQVVQPREAHADNISQTDSPSDTFVGGAEAEFASHTDSLPVDSQSFSEASTFPPKRCQSKRPLNWFDANSIELRIFNGIDGSKQPQDFGVNANLGIRSSVSLSGPLVYDRGLGWQIGTAFTASENAVRVYELLGEEDTRWQSYTTLGVFQRLDSNLAWGLAYDYLYQESYDDAHAGQFRGTLSQQISNNDWVGVRGSIDEHGDSAEFLTTTLHLRPISQGGAFWTHRWPFQARTTTFLGMAESHSESNAVTGFSAPTKNKFVFGLDIFIPIAPSLAMTGSTNLMRPADTGTVDAFLGFEWIPGVGSRRAGLQRFSALQSVASPTTMPIDLR